MIHDGKVKLHKLENTTHVFKIDNFFISLVHMDYAIYQKPMY